VSDLFERYKTEVRGRLSVRDLVEECKPKGLRATGASSLICCSPLRPDKTPSFSVFQNGGGEYVGFDHATRESFDLYSFIEKKESLTFADAVKWAGDRVGLPWESYKREHGDGRASAPPPAGISQEEWDRARAEVLALDERQLVGDVQQAMVDLAHGMFLRSSLPAYVERRWGISPETQSRFMLGFVPHGFAVLLEDLHEAGDFPYGRKQIVKTGWFVERSRVAGDPDPELRCIFDGRLLYPYMLHGKCRYAAARIIFEEGIEPSYFVGREWDQAKFKKAMVHSESRPHVSAHVQNNLLYNADNLARSRSGFKRICIVEGPSDCMAMVEWGYDCVAPVTTSVRAEDIPALIRDVERYQEVVLATDTDVTDDGRRPGLEGALRMAPELMKAGKKARLLVFPLPKGQTKVDPASWALEWKRAGNAGDPFEKLMTELPTVARGLVRFLPTEMTAERLPETLGDIVKFIRLGKLIKAEIEEIAKDVRKHLKDAFSYRAILLAMGQAIEKSDKDDRIEDEDKSLPIEGAVVEHGGHGDPDHECGYMAWSKTGGARVADFVLQPERIRTIDGEDSIEVSVWRRLNERVVDRWVVPNDAWVSKREFKRALGRVATGGVYSGTDDNVQGIKKLVSDRAERLGVPRMHGVDLVGLYQTKNGLRLVLPKETWDEHGAMPSPDMFLAGEPPPIATKIRVDSAQDPASVDELVKRTMDLFFKLNDVTLLTTICAWVVGCYFLPSIRDLNGGKASILNVYGSPGSGKSTLMHKIVNLTFLPFDESFEPATPAAKQFSTIRSLSWSNMFCNPFDEFREKEANVDFLRLLRTGFSGGVETRGRADLTMRSFSLVGAVQVTGEQRVSVDEALGERLVMVGLNKTLLDEIKAKAKPALHELLAARNRWRVANDILQWRMRVPPESIEEWWNQARAETPSVLESVKVTVPPRTFDVCTDMVFRLRVLREWLGHRGDARRMDLPLAADTEVVRRLVETAFETELSGDSNVTLVSHKSNLVRALEEATVCAIQGTFEEGKGWRLCMRNARKMLVIHPGVLASVLAKEASQRKSQDTTNGVAALKHAAREEHQRGGDLGWLVDVSFPYRMGSNDEVGSDEPATTIRARCWLMDVVKASDMAGLDLDWPGKVAEWGGRRAKPMPGSVGLWGGRPIKSASADHGE
jgi:DNA primase